MSQICPLISSFKKSPKPKPLPLPLPQTNRKLKIVRTGDLRLHARAWKSWKTKSISFISFSHQVLRCNSRLMFLKVAMRKLLFMSVSDKSQMISSQHLYIYKSGKKEPLHKREDIIRSSTAWKILHHVHDLTDMFEKTSWKGRCLLIKVWLAESQMYLCILNLSHLLSWNSILSNILSTHPQWSVDFGTRIFGNVDKNDS